MNITPVLALLSTTAVLLSISACAPASTQQVADTSSPVAIESPSQFPSASPVLPKVETGLAKRNATSSQLQYLIEEEKLAHDVYTKMYELWGAQVFGNILQSEQSHQSQVLTIMSAMDVADPRSSEIGVFENSDLQKLYDELIAKGIESAVDAYEVGVAIEELDIADLTEMLSTATDADMIAMMENLRRGSENHLRAFNRQL